MHLNVKFDVNLDKNSKFMVLNIIKNIVFGDKV